MTESIARYSVPALERGLDVLELLAAQEGGMGLAAIAAALNLTSSAVFRSLVVLEQRGYLRRDGDTFTLSLRLFQLAHTRPPVRRLLDAALPAMRQLAQAGGQACHLSVPDAGSILIVADVEGPGPLNLAFRLGSRWPFAGTASGRVLLAFQDAATRAHWLHLAAAPLTAQGTKRLAAIVQRGFDIATDETMSGIVDLAAPVCDRRAAVAALAVSGVRRLSQGAHDEAALARLLCAAADQITQALGGRPRAQEIIEEASQPWTSHPPRKA